LSLRGGRPVTRWTAFAKTSLKGFFREADEIAVSGVMDRDVSGVMEPEHFGVMDPETAFAGPGFETPGWVGTG
jgi:hypothetical protein